VTNEAVDDEVDAGVNDCREVSNVGEAADDSDRFEQDIGVTTVKNNINVEELVNIDNNPGTVEDKEGNNDAEKNKEKIDFILHFLFRSKSLNFHIFEIANDSNIEDEHRE